MPSTVSYTVSEDLLTDSDLHPKVIYAGFWLRLAACAIDSIIFFGVWVFLFLSASIMLNSASMGDKGIDREFYGALLIAALYFPLMECSSAQATLGKKIVGIKVTDINGNRVALGRIFVRTAMKLLSSFFFGTGYIFIFFTDKKQAWHDTIARTLVVMK
jgi:uncharacterized RDD family membrane protein YckC